MVLYIYNYFLPVVKHGTMYIPTTNEVGLEMGSD